LTLLGFLLAGGVRAQELLSYRQAEPWAAPAGAEPQRQTGVVAAPLSWWRIELVDGAGSVGQQNSLALDSSGYPHISYYDSTSDVLKYAYKDATGWHIEVADYVGGRFNSLALDSAGYPHISHYSYSTGDLRHAYKDAAGWHRELVDGLLSDDVGQYTSLALLNSQPHISYYDVTHGDLKYAYKDAGGSPHWETVDTSGDVGRGSSLALDSSGRPHITYYDLTQGYLKYAFQDAGGWHINTLDTSSDAGRYNALVLRQTLPVKLLHVSYTRYNHATVQGDLRYAYTDILGWHFETVADAENLFGWTALAVESSGRPHISLHNRADLRVVYAYKKDTWNWQVETVATTGGDWYEYNTALALDATGRPHITFYDDAGKDLWYAYKTYGTFLPLVMRGI
jgi:hypothetical protein